MFNKSLLTIACFLAAITFTRAADPPAKHHVADLAWMAGTWRSPANDPSPSEEIWSEPSRGNMIGMFRSGAIFEFLMLEDDSKGITKRFKHYRPGFAEMEKDPLTLRVTELTARKVVFTSTIEGKLKSIVYEREGSDQVTVTVNTMRADKPVQIVVKMERVKGK